MKIHIYFVVVYFDKTQHFHNHQLGSDFSDIFFLLDICISCSCYGILSRTTSNTSDSNIKVNMFHIACGQCAYFANDAIFGVPSACTYKGHALIFYLPTTRVYRKHWKYREWFKIMLPNFKERKISSYK